MSTVYAVVTLATWKPLNLLLSKDHFYIKHTFVLGLELKCIYFETRSHYVAQAELKLALLLPLPPELAGITSMCHNAWLIALNLFFRLALFLMALTVLWNTGLVSCRMSFKWDLPSVFLMRLGLYIVRNKAPKEKCYFHHITSRNHTINVTYQCWY